MADRVIWCSTLDDNERTEAYTRVEPPTDRHRHLDLVLSVNGGSARDPFWKPSADYASCLEQATNEEKPVEYRCARMAKEPLH